MRKTATMSFFPMAWMVLLKKQPFCIKNAEDRNSLQKDETEFSTVLFLCENENAIRTQVWCTLIAHLLMTVIQKNGSNEEGIFSRGFISSNPSDKFT